MNRLSIFQIAEFAGAAISSGDSKLSIDKISTDSRALKRGELFVALHGENFDGHNFVESAAKAGAAGAIVDSSWKGKVPENFALIRVKDTLQAYQKLAANYRKSLSLKVVAITGSNGKTSTKDFAAAVLARRFQVTKTEGNFNNHVGLPRTILEATSRDEVAIWEIGMNHPGEVAALAKLAEPGVAIITNIGVAHIEFMGSREAIATEKGALVEAVGAEGTVILNGDDPFTNSIAGRARAKLVAAPLARARLQIRQIHGVQFIDDSYNANPDSMKAALRTLVELDTDGKRIAVLGEMKELGSESEHGHREVGETAATLEVDHLIAIGTVAAAIASAAERAGLRNSRTVNSPAEAAEILSEIAASGDLVLIKGSRAARTERVMEEFRSRESAASSNDRQNRNHSRVGTSP